ncbi:hypothetical protein [Mesorhizobium onobrychidis]|uniref:LysM domain-containing protein n=1 Tax=Mesorhizobium onobrychidis TaxID=2775404 RepID=A0ABY5R739_9HYPH|nr:hypothetical protein [Mesorhizobium onobrychidis]UVC19345.1 hypothetical protein IHQ72_36210 [Mesorhizobium onobrychidis]
MTKILLHSTGAGSAWFEADETRAPFTAKLFKVKFGAQQDAQGTFVLGTPLIVNEAAVADDGADKRLVTWKEAVENASGEAQRIAALELNRLHDALRKLAIKADGSTHNGEVASFVGIVGVADITTEFYLEINPAGLLANVGGDEPVFRAGAEALFSAGFASPFAVAGVDAVVRIEVELTRQDVLRVLPRIDVPALPHLGLAFPHIPLPKWSLHGLHLPDIDLSFLRIPLQSDLNLQVEFDPKPAIDFAVANDKLTLLTTASKASVKLAGTEILVAEGVALNVNGNEVSVTTTKITAAAAGQTIDTIDLKEKLPGPFVVVLFGVKVDVAMSGPPSGPLTVVVTFDITRAIISARTDPNLQLAVSPKIELTYAGGQLTPKLIRLDVVEPYPIKLALFAANIIEEQARRLLSLIQKIEVPKLDAPGTPDLPSLDGFLAVLRRIGALAAAAASWLAQQGAAGVRALAGLAEAAFKLISEVISTLAEAIARAGQTVAKHVIVEVRLDLSHWRVVQIVVTPSDPGVGALPFARELLGFRLEIPFELTPALVCDVEKGWLALVVQSQGAGNQTATLSTDLWLGHESAPAESVSGLPDTNGNPNQPLLQLKVTPKDAAVAVALIVIDNGRARFLQELKTEKRTTQPILGPGGGVVVPIGHLLLAARWSSIEELKASSFDIDPQVDTGRILSLFRAPKAEASPSENPLQQFSQHIRITASNPPTVVPPKIGIPLDVEIRISDNTINTKLNLDIDLNTLSMKIAGGKFNIEMKDDEFNLLGLRGKFVKLVEKVPFTPLFLDLSDGDPRLGLNSEVTKIVLSYDKLSTSGSSLDFEVDQFIVSRDGIDLSAQVQSNPVTLAGVDMPFRFDKGQLSIKRNQIQTFALTGHGNLPPALVGEAKASIELNFTQENGKLALQAAKAVLDKSADPLRCEGTQFTITVTKLGLKFVQQGQYHFYFTLTGSAEFRPSSSAFAEGLLKNLSSLRIVLDEAPLAADPRVLLNHIQFQVTVEPPKRSTFFDLFSFELRGVGFHPSAPEFGGSPAFSISGQVNFTDFGDIVTPRFDFHKLWIAPPERGKSLPRVRFDGLGVGLSLGSMAEASGTAIAVDDKLPTLFPPDVLPADVTAKGFLASGSLRIQGWASMSASMGFLQLEKKGVAEKRPAFFLYIQRNDMSEKIPTPIGTIFLREVGFGFGYRYTLAGIAAAEKAESPRELVKILDEVSKYQGNLADVKAWWPTYDNAALTLALRGMFSLTSASSSSSYNEEGEKNLPNLALFDVVVALRTDLTFLMNLRIWIAYNYADWREGRRTNAPWTSNPSLTGYLYLSVPRREFLARAVYNPGADIGDHPKLPDELKAAMKAVRWSSTLYIRPGLFHMEYGWPYELGFSVGKPNGNFFLSVEGGTVLRFEDAAVLYGLAFRARGFAAFSYDTGGSFGAAITGRADFALGAKLIAYLSANISESMFYGVITLDLTLEFSVRMWLRTKWFSLSCGFSRSITIHIGVELLIQPGGLAARIEASVAVGAFGRTLSLGIGFSLGSSGRLAEARARVERFLALGLGSSYPNPEAGVPVSRPAPLPEPSRADNAKKSDNRLDEALNRREASESPQDEEPAEKLVGVGFGEVSYWALLVPISGPKGAAEDDYYVVQLIPRDNYPLDKHDSDTRSHFYAAPLNAETESTPTYIIQGLEQDEILKNAKSDSANPRNIFTDWSAKFGLNGTDNAGDENARSRPTLKEAFQAGCFMASGNIGGIDYDATDIESVPWEKTPYNLPDDPEAANIMLAAAARSLADCGPRFKQMQQVEEARSCFIATVAESAQQMAALFNFVNNKPTLEKAAEDHIASKLEFDPRALGLTFVLSGKRIDELFPDRDRQAEVPAASEKFRVRTRVPREPGPSTNPVPPPVLLFNPPERMFRSMSPALNEVGIERKATGVKVNFDLEPAWSRSTTPYNDPEFHLKHYRIERRITGLGTLPPKTARPGVVELTVKSGDHIAIVVLKSDDGKPLPDQDGKIQLRKRRLRTRLQFVDDLKDLDPVIRAALLPAALSREKVDKAVTVTEHTRVVYAVVPVDSAGTAGPVGSLHSEIILPTETPERGLLKAIARIRYADMPPLQKAPTPVADKFLELTVEEEEDAVSAKAAEKDETVPPKLRTPSTDYVLRVRTERTIAVGQFGADALSQARSEPPVPAREEDPGQHETDITLQKDTVPGKPVRITRIARRLRTQTTPDNPPEPESISRDYTVSNANWKKLLAILEVQPQKADDVARVRASRLYLRPKPKTEIAKLAPEWSPVQLQLWIGGEDQPAVNTTIERFEHPVDVKFEPFKSQYIFPSSGRLHLWYPLAEATFDDFVSGNAETVQLLCDADQRTGVKLAWTARPDHVAVQGNDQFPAKDLHTLIAGYDLFSLDATAVPRNEDGAATTLRQVSSIGRVQRLPALERGQEPSETGDFARVGVLYPSETQRLVNPVLDRRFGKRRTTWYSPAESFLIWPTRPLRRSVLTMPEENDVAALFQRQRPCKILVEWLEAPAGMPSAFGFASEDPGQLPTTLVDNLLSGRYLENASENDPLTVDQARRLLRGLVLVGDLGGSDAIADETPNKFANLALRLTPLDKSGKPLRDADKTISAHIKLSLAPSLHPILADVLDVLQYDLKDTPSYRRYEPVLESAPQLNAETLAAYLDETAADRDPAGWGILRTLGLAAALRLYDVERGHFLTSDEALPLLREALNLVLPRYASAPDASGAPFVDVMFTTDGLSELVSHHGAAPAPSQTDAANVLRAEKALALVQIELRPIVQPLQKLGAELPAPLRQRRIRYAILKLNAAAKVVTLRTATTGERIAIEIEPLVPTDGSSQRRVLMVQGWGDKKEFPIGGEPVSNAMMLKTEGKIPDAELAYVRLVALDETADLSDSFLEALKLSKDARIEPANEAAIEQDGPWGRFASLPDAWLAALLFGDGIETPVGLAAMADRSAPINTIATLARILGRFPNKTDSMKIPDTALKRLELAARIGPWTRRFMEQGPARPVSGRAGLALAMLTRPNPWRLAPDHDGRLSITLLETDRWGKARKYAVRPFGRYENLAHAVETQQQAAAAKTGKPAKTAIAVQTFEASLPGQMTKPQIANALRQYFADAVVERTEPLAAPVILATRRNDKADAHGVIRPGKSVQIIVSRHPEEILSDANIRVDAGLSLRHVAVGFWREFSAPQWADHVAAAASRPIDVDLLEAFGPFRQNRHDYQRLPLPQGLSIIKEAMREQFSRISVDDVDIELLRAMYQRHPNLWRGAYVLNMAAMPYGFRLHATAHVAAGVVVSPSSVATVDESGYQLVLPWKRDNGETGPWQDRNVAPAPSWSILRPDDENQPVKVVVEWPLVRIVDGLFEEARNIWLGNEDAPNLYRLPDPAVSYRISIVTDDGQVRVGEVEIGAVTNDPDDKSKPRQALYLTQLIGARFVNPELERALTLRPDAPVPPTAYTHYAARLNLPVKGEPTNAKGEITKPVWENFAPAALQPMLTPADLHLLPADTAQWGVIAPEPNVNGAAGTLVLTVTPPQGVADPVPPPPAPPPAPEWTAFRNHIQAFVDAMHDYVNGSGSERFKQIAKELADAVRPYAVDRVANWPGPKSGTFALPKTLNVRWIAGLPAEDFTGISVAAPVSWFWLPNPDAGATGGAARTAINTVLDTAIAAAAGNTGRVDALKVLKAAVLEAMRARTISRRRSVDEGPKHNLLPIRSDEVPAGINLGELRKLPSNSPVDFLAMIHLKADAGRTVDQIKAVFTALENIPNAADTLAGLAAMMTQPSAAADIAMRWSCGAAAEPELNKLQPASGPEITTMILVKPATRSETAALGKAHQDLPPLADSLTRTMVFGPRRHLVIQAFHGLAEPQDDIVQRGR